jgi:hypothetical protein
MKIVKHYGILGLYVICLGSLSRILLDSRRDNGFEPVLFDIFLVFASTVFSVLILNYKFDSWTRRLGLKSGRRPSSDMVKELIQRLRRVAIGSLILMSLCVIVDRIELVDQYTPYHPLLILVSVSGSILVESMIKISAFRKDH